MAVARKDAPPYLRIVAELRRRIAEGELAPGERVPSTRRIAQEWNVAPATATKALTALRQEGLVEPRARVGTVVAAPAGRRAEPDHRPRATAGSGQELSRERIVRAAMEIADAEGLAALTMRGVAARLGTAAMSPYRYVNGRDDLVLLMADAAHGELVYPAEAPAHWRARLEAGARALWALHRAHPWLAQIGPLTRPLLLPNLLAYADWMLSALDGHGLPPTAMQDLNILLYTHVQGVAVHLEREAQAASSTGLTDQEWLDTQESAFAALLASGDYPTFTKVAEGFGADGYDLHLDKLFELGLTSMLDGLTPLVEGGGGVRG
ncbi:TetR/AcrR family transcriptional regulator C-terminal domain-containing protein [Streptomyces varsoviensis]|uniref:TetR/AcrR family transcriptional regulator C-terminal domain-containing protein n=1 Tax=Streptomyces varsoviensis TaxID=67373 RepID=UPI00340696AD